VDETVGKALSAIEEAKLLEACRTRRARCLLPIVTLALHTGMRRGEIQSLRWSQVDFLNRTVTGRAMQAVAQNTEAAKVLGINVKRMVLYVFLINAVLAVVAALLVTPTYLAKFDMGDSIGQKAFFAAIIGGFNQTRGALLGGVLIGILENVVGFYISPAYKEGVALLLFLLVILFRPEGLLGKSEERKV
jgi:branched-chain amino acid transport system permease protein